MYLSAAETAHHSPERSPREAPNFEPYGLAHFQCVIVSRRAGMDGRAKIGANIDVDWVDTRFGLGWADHVWRMGAGSVA